ncbi:MAG: DUF2442 domain-containing protein [bacterium]|nr:DUF2442 domain-containing protein [bacterium]
MVLTIIKAEYISGYAIKLVFSDGTVKNIDFEDFLQRSKNPMTRKFLDRNEFKSFKIEYGDLVWSDYELCFPIIDLYEDNISKETSTAAA